jgi:uncharacterized protein
LPRSIQSPACTECSTPDVAPPWHTGALVALIVAVAATGALLASRGVAVQAPVAPASGRVVVYLQMFLVAWGLLLYVSSVGRPRGALRALLGKGWTSAGRAGADLALAASGWLLLRACELAWARLFAGHPSASVGAMLPRTALEGAAWVVVSVSVALSEEVVFRGYLQAQFEAFTGRASVALALQAMLFGLAHGEQGLGAMVRLAVYGLAFGALARWRQSLWPGILCHAWTNLASGLIHV